MKTNMKTSVILVKPDKTFQVYQFEDRILTNFFVIGSDSLSQHKFFPELKRADKIFVLLDDFSSYYFNILRLPLVKAGELRKAVNLELISIFGEKARFSHDVVYVKEEEGQMFSFVQVFGIRESYFQSLLESLKGLKDLVEVIIPYPVTYTDLDSLFGVLLLEVYEDRSKITILSNGTVYLYRVLSFGSHGMGSTEFTERIQTEIERSTYFIRQNFDRNFEIKKIYYFLEDRGFPLNLASLRAPLEALDLVGYRGGEVAPYMLLQKAPKDLRLNIVPPVVSYREISPYIFALLTLAFLIYNGFFLYSYQKLLNHKRAMERFMSNLKTGILTDLNFARKNKMLLVTRGIVENNKPVDELLKIFSAVIPRDSKIANINCRNQKDGVDFEVDFEFLNTPDFKKAQLLDAIADSIAKISGFERISKVKGSESGDVKIFRITGFWRSRKG